MDKMNSIWLEHPDFPKYRVSPDGQVLSLNRTPKILRPRLGNGYHAVVLGGKTVLIHRLVAFVYCPKSDEQIEVNHKNGIKTDNRAENLEWVTKSENHRHAFRTGLKDGLHRRGERNNFAKLTAPIVLEIRRRLEADSTPGLMGKLAAEFGVSRPTISLIRSRKVWAHLSPGG